MVKQVLIVSFIASVFIASVADTEGFYRPTPIFLEKSLNSILRKQLLSKFEEVQGESVYWIPCVMTWNGVCIRALPQKFPIRMLRH